MIASHRPSPALPLLADWLLALSLLSGCAGGVANPTLVASPSPGVETSRVEIGEVPAAAARRVVMTKEDLERISRRVEADLAATYPDRVVKPGDAPLPDMVNVKLVFTEYDKGNAFTRLMLAGLGQIRIGANVVLIDAANNQTVGEFEASKDFSFGGLYGGATSVEDV